MSYLKQLKKYPIIAGFFLFLAVMCIVDLFIPDKAVSEFENRELAQNPAFSVQKLFNNEWTQEYGEYVRDQFVLRDEWVSMYGALEMAQGKLEDGGVWFADDGYLIAKNDSWSETQQRLFPANVNAVAQLAGAFPGKVQAMLIPSPANILSDKLPQFWQPHQIDENARLDEAFATLQAAGAGVIDLRGSFTAADQAGEQVYYRTDHHWTTDGGARIAYQAYCEAVGLVYTLPDESLRVDVPGFYGTNYAKTKRPGIQADILTYYNLPNTMSIEVTDGKGGFITQTGQPIMNDEALQPMDKYAAFLHGNNRYTSISGNGEGRVLVFKDSYGNSFVPYLVENYAQVDVIDLRSWPSGESILEFVEAGAYDDILVLYSFAAFSEDAEVATKLNR